MEINDSAIYAVIIERGPNNFSAYVPDLPGCVSTGNTVTETERNIREAIELHLRGMMEDHDSLPRATSIAANVRVTIPTAAIAD